jgi:hypothetical protein
MNFVFCDLILWRKNGTIRKVHFEPNKVNVITGESHTGKTAILGIIDYCLFSSSHKIPQSIINENVDWYGILFLINDKKFLISRKAPTGSKTSADYYFSSVGEVPQLPKINTTEVAVKSIMDVEFSIDHQVQMPYGGATLASGSKISLRYFLMFNTISEDIIENSSVFFDKQNSDRYREALPRIFDLAVGIDDMRNILARERKVELERELRRIERKNSKTTVKYDEFLSEISDVSRKANEYALIENATTTDEAVVALRLAVDQGVELLKDSALRQPESTWGKEYDNLSSEMYLINTKIRNARRFSAEYFEYKEELKKTADSLKPILFLRQKNAELVKTSIYDEIISTLESDYTNIRKAISSKTPIDIKITDLIAELESKVTVLKSKVDLLGQRPKSLANDREKFFFLGEIKAKLDLFTDPGQEVSSTPSSTLSRIKDELNGLVVNDVITQRELFVKMFEEIVQGYIALTGDALANYRTYKPVFNYNEKKLQLRKPKSDEIEYIGSSSNYMFMHLYFFLGLHEVILRKNVKFVPSFIIMDQPSRPYYGADNKKLKKSSDTDNIRLAFQLLDGFITTSNEEIKKQFQIIVFEHVPPSTWDGLKNVYLVEEFEAGNALII